MAETRRVPVLAPDPKSGRLRFATVDEGEADLVVKSGGKLLTKDEARTQEAIQRQDERADKAGALGTAQSVVGAVGGVLNPLAFTGGAGSAGEAYNRGVTQGLSAGLVDAAARQAIDATAGKEAGDKYAQLADDAKLASPTASGAGELAGFTAGMALPASPAGLIGKAGSAAERGAGLFLKGGSTALGKAAQAGVKLGARGAVEGGIYAGVTSAADDVVHDQDVNGSKLYAAVGHGALAGALLGGGLGAGGSLLSSGARSVRLGLTRGAREAAARAEAERLAAIEARRTPSVGQPAEQAIAPEVVPGRPSVSPAAEGPAAAPGAPRRTLDLANVSAPGRGASFPRAEGSTLADIGVEPAATRIPNESAPAGRRAALGRSAPRSIGDATAFEDIFPTRAPEPGLAGAPRLAADQAWKAVGGGFGLQSTRFAKQAAKYFPNGTTDLGEAVLKHRLIDIPEGASPVQAAWTAARSGTPDAIAAKAGTALDDVGTRLGDITQQSGARVQLLDVHKAIDGVRQQYARIAGYEHVVAALDNYEASIAQKLGGSVDGTASVQQVLEQRKGLDRLVYEETKTLDPKGRVAALREVRTNLEGAITDALDKASGQVPGALKAQYAALKKDYHALSIIKEAAEDSAARAAKGATFGLGEKFAVAGALAHGNVASAPVLALGGKVLRERGNAAAAALLSKMNEQQTLARLLRQADEAVGRAAKGALREAPPAGPKGKVRQNTAAEGRAEQREVQAKAQALVKWNADVRANPQRLLDSLTNAGEVVGRAAGPQTSAGYTQATLKALQFIQRYIPVKERRDPLDPRSVPPLTFEESSRLIRAATYATKPATVWADFERGIVTPEGIAAAQEFMPDQFSDFRAQLFDHVTTHLSRGGRYTAAQRLRVDKLLGIPGGADLRPDALQLLQANLAAPEGPSDGPTPAKQGGGNGPVNLKVQQSGFDAVEARKSAG